MTGFFLESISQVVKQWMVSWMAAWGASCSDSPAQEDLILIHNHQLPHLSDPLQCSPQDHSFGGLLPARPSKGEVLAKRQFLSTTGLLFIQVPTLSLPRPSQDHPTVRGSLPPLLPFSSFPTDVKTVSRSQAFLACVCHNKSVTRNSVLESASRRTQADMLRER